MSFSKHHVSPTKNKVFKLKVKKNEVGYSTVTDLAKFLGWSTLQPRNTAM